MCIRCARLELTHEDSSFVLLNLWSMSIGHVAAKRRIKHQFMVGRWSRLWSQLYATTYLALWVIQPWNHNWNHIEIRESCFELHCWSAAAAVVETLAGCTSGVLLLLDFPLRQLASDFCLWHLQGLGGEGIWDCHYSWMVDINGWDW